MTLEHPEDLVTVFASGDAVRIALAKAALEAAGVPFLAKGEGVQDFIGFGRLGGFNIATGPAEIQVRRRDVAIARQALRDLQDSRGGDATPCE